MALIEVAAAGPEPVGIRRVELDLAGLSCGACARRVEKALNRIEGVRASVDFGARVATVEAAPGVGVAELCAAVRKAGYGATERRAGAGGTAQSVKRPQLSPLRAVIAAATLLLRWLMSSWHVG
jgi:cation transport ATPase